MSITGNESLQIADPVISDSIASELILDFLSSEQNVAQLARQYGIPLFSLLRWFKSDLVRQALDDIEALQKHRQTLAAGAASPRAISRLVEMTEKESGKLAVNAATVLLRFATSTSRPTRAQRADHKPPQSKSKASGDSPVAERPASGGGAPSTTAEPTSTPRTPVLPPQRNEFAPSILDAIICPSLPRVDPCQKEEPGDSARLLGSQSS
ncbi:MAG: hypothetical protein ACREJD_01245 [Phycisphaerales bacterium]